MADRLRTIRDASRVGPRWANGFVKRHPELTRGGGRNVVTLWKMACMKPSRQPFNQSQCESTDAITTRHPRAEVARRQVSEGGAARN
jgi:hypothetical protein